MYKRNALRYQWPKFDVILESLFMTECIDVGGTFFYTPRDGSWKFWRFGGLDIDIRLVFLTLQLTATYREEAKIRGQRVLVR